MSRPTTSSSRCCCGTCAKTSTVEEGGLRLEFRPTSRFSDKPIKPLEHVRAVETEQSNTTALVDNQLRRQGLSQARTRHQSGDRDRPLPDRGRGLRQHAGAARQRRTGRGQPAKRDRDRSCLRREPGRRLDRDLGLSRPLRRRAAPAGVERTSGRKRRAGLLSALHVANRTDASPRCISRCPAATNLPISRRSRSTPQDVQRWTDDVLARAERIFEALKQRRDADQGRRPPAGRPAAGAARGSARPAERAASIRRRRPEDPPSRRLPSRTDADRQGRHLHHRFRGRAAPAARRAAAQGARRARRRRPDPLDRLFGHRRAGARAEGRARRAGQARRRARGMARPRRPRRSSPAIARP